MTTTTRKPSAALAAILILCLVACTTSQVITNLQIALDAVTAALPILASVTGVPAGTVMQVETYVTATNAALGEASTILAGSGTTAEKAAQIAAAFATIAAPVVPAQFDSLAALVATLAGDVAAFLASVPGTPAAATVAHTPHATTLILSSQDKDALAHCVATANANAAKLLSMKTKGR
jgi:hypothetical protein